MSTKTTFKRVALVTVAALGFGVLTSVAPASAATYSSMSVGYNSLTVVGAAGTNYGFIPVTLTNDDGDAHQLYNTESLTATVTAWPTGVDSTTASTDLSFTVETRTDLNAFSAATNTKSTSPTANAGSAWIGYSSNGAGASATSAASPSLTGTYWFGVKTSGAALAVDKGTYQSASVYRIRLVLSLQFLSQLSL